MTSTSTGWLPTSATTSAPSATLTQVIYGPFHTIPEARGAQAVNRSSIAALAFLVWDILITFDDEVKYIWPRAWNYTKFVYFFVRYIPVLVEASILCIGTELTPHFHFTPHDCFIWQMYQAAAATSTIIAVDTILILRVRALYSDSRIIHTIINCAFVVEVTGMIIAIVLAVPKIQFNDVCLVTHSPKSMALWAVSLIFQALLFSLTAYRFYVTLKAGWGDVPLMSLLMRDGTWAFFLLFFIFLGYGILLIIPHHSFAGVLYGWLLVAFSFSGYRIILNLSRYSSRQVAVRTPGRLPTHTTQPTNTNIQFTSHHASTSEASSAYELRSLFSNSKTSRTAGQSSGLSSISELKLEP